MKSNKSRSSKTIELSIEGMSCGNCETTIKKSVEKLDGVKAATVDHVLGKAIVTYEPRKTDERKIASAIDSAGYSVKGKSRKKDGDGGDYFEIPEKALYASFALGIALIIAGAYFLLKNAFGISFDFPELSANASYALMFGLGILTGFHCIAMCGGFIVSYTAKDSKASNHLKYGLSKTVSYAIIGAIFGAIGSIIAFTPMMRGIAAILAGLFLLVFGLNMLGFLPSLRKLRIPQPGFVARLKAEKSPVAIGLLNGLFIACGPLQAMYIFAAGTGSAVEGALSLMFFGLGTLPVLLGFGMAASFVSKTATHKILKLSGVLVILLGLVMVNRGFALSGSGYDINTINANIAAKSQHLPNDAQIAVQKGVYQEIRMDVTNYGWVPDKFVLKKGVPVRWIINGKEINGCNNAIVVPKYGLNFRISRGEQTIEFTPAESGTIPWSCWMGMIPGTFIVRDDITDAESIKEDVAAIPAANPSGGGCGCGRR